MNHFYKLLCFAISILALPLHAMEQATLTQTKDAQQEKMTWLLDLSSLPAVPVLAHAEEKSLRDNTPESAAIKEEKSPLDNASESPLTEKVAPATEEPCSICLNVMDKTEICQLACGHNTFHAECIYQWTEMKKHNNCPLCRVSSDSSSFSFVDPKEINALDSQLKALYTIFKGKNFLKVTVPPIAVKPKMFLKLHQALLAFDYYILAALTSTNGQYRGDASSSAESYAAFFGIPVIILSDQITLKKHYRLQPSLSYHEHTII